MKQTETHFDEIQAIDENDFATAIDLAKIDFTPAFVHGLLTAYCCEDERSHGWATALIDDIDQKNEILTAQLRYLNQAKNIIGAQLSDSELGFQLLLNNTAETLHDEALLTREWASGFSLGVETLGLAEQIKNDELSSEFLADLSQVTAMPLPSEDDLDAASTEDEYSDNYDSSDEVFDHDTGDDTRTDILEIQEYCRAGAISVFLARWKE